MSPSHTVENYLKTIFQAQMAQTDREALVPMGHVASAIGVVPGTATTMVKALTESGLVQYEPYSGVRLTAAGEKLAALVLRRHRLIELFLVKVMGMSWTEVHEEAEHLEHAVSDRLIDRIDAMLGRPAVDPHGDPIPDPEGAVDRLNYDSLLTCPMNAPVTVSRVSDQDREFLEFVERHELKPGDVVRVEERDPAGDSVRLRGRDDRQITIGTRAASKVLVQAKLILLLVLLAGSANAQPATPPKSAPFQIMDNSFLVEEAYNQPAGVFQNIFGILKLGDSWSAAFTQEWPVRSQTHQLSYTVALVGASGENGAGDVVLNYRVQASTDGDGRPAFSPRASVILPSASAREGLGAGSAGLQINLPFSKQTGDWHWTWNGGLTWLPRAKVYDDAGAGEPLRRANLLSPFLAGSSIYRVRPMLHFMMESVLAFDESLTPQGTERQTTLTLSPGLRGGWNLGDRQLIVGFAIPIARGGGNEIGGFGYFSYELPFGR